MLWHKIQFMVNDFLQKKRVGKKSSSPCFGISESKHEIANISVSNCLRPYHFENASSRPIIEAKQLRAQLVLGWMTASEYWVLKTFRNYSILIFVIHEIGYTYR